MTRCRYWDCGWCYCNTGNSNDINGKCMSPMECQQLASQQPQQQQPKKEDYQVTEQNIRDAFEREVEYKYLDKRMGKDGLYINGETWQAFMFYKSGYIAAFKVILESEVDG